MKKPVFTLLTLLLCFQAFAQDYDEPVKTKKDKPPRKETEKHKIIRPLLCPSVYVGTSTGINNNTGLLGVSFDVPFAKTYSAEGGAGISSWGYKFSLSGKYYLKPCQRGWAFGAGLTYNTGLQNYKQTLETVTGDQEEVTLNLHPQTNVFLAAYRYWNLGKQYNRFYLELGYSVPLSAGNRYDQTSGDPLSDNSKFTMNFISPGGLIIAFGFSFGVN